VIGEVILKMDLQLLGRASASVLTTTAPAVIIMKAVVIKSYLARMKLMFCIWGCYRTYHFFLKMQFYLGLHGLLKFN
jgi:hypothetical protein